MKNEKQDVKPSPLPWVVGRLTDSFCSEIFSRSVSMDNGIASIWYSNSRDPRGVASEANAALIVRAVNSHAGLVEALKRAKKFFKALERGYTPTPIPPNSDSGLDWDAPLAVIAALRAAGEEP